MARQDRIGTHATSVFNDGPQTNVVYHRTAVVKFDHRTIVLNSGGWRTTTTKTRMNQTSNQYDLGFSVYQKNRVWYIDFDGKTLEFYDGITLRRKKCIQ